jgi:hypothetical protein
LKRHVVIRGKKVPVKTKRISALGYAYKRHKSDRRPVTRRIELHSNLRGAKKLSVLVHEMIHQLDIGLAERTVLRLESGIVEMIEDNPEVFHELADRLNAGEEPA